MRYSGTFGGFPVTGSEVEVTGFNVAALGSFPIDEQFSLFGKARPFHVGYRCERHDRGGTLLGYGGF